MRNLAELNIGDAILVNGFVMLKNLDAGAYVVCDIDNISYSFRKPKGTKVACRHYINSVDAKLKPNCKSDINYIERIGK